MTRSDERRADEPTWDRVTTQREELVGRILNAVPGDAAREVLPGLVLRRHDSPGEPVAAVTQPCFCIIAQGSKEVRLGDEVFRYDPSQYLVATVDVPMVGQIIEASPAKPYLSVQMALDPAIVTDVLVQANDAARPVRHEKAVSVSPLDPDLLDATVRLVRLGESLTDYAVLGPLVVREIVYRLITGAQGGRMRHLAEVGGRRSRIADAVRIVRERFDQPLRVDDLAQTLGMSVSSLHAHFKAVTAMSPLRFQKELRLQEARRLMLGEGLHAAEAGYRVGYDDPAYFSREYRRHFGEPPRRDVTRLRERANGSVDGTSTP